MLRVDPTLNHIPARREHVVSLYESINQPLVNIPNHGTAPTGAFLLGTRNEHGFYTVFVYLHQPETRAVIIYVSEPRNLNAEQFRLEETEAVRFVESMGFMVDSVHFRQLGPVEQDAVIARVPIFRPPVATLDLYEVHEEVGQQAADPIFGGMGAVGDEIFRRAGLGMPQGPMPGQGMQGHGTGPIGQNVRFSGPGSGSLPGMPNFGPPTPSQRGMNFSMPPQMPQPMQPMPSLPPQPAQPVQPAPLAQPAQPQASPAQNAEALERLGRLLAAFSFLFALSFAAAPACKSGGASETLTTTEQNQIDMGEQHLAGRQWAEAISAFAEVLKGEPNEKTALRGTGLAYLSLGRKDEAEPYYRRAIEADPKWSEPKNELAGILISTGRCDEAEKLLLAVTQDIFYPTPEFAEHNLALALSCQGRQEEAVAKLETLLVKRPQFCLGYLTLSQLSAQTRQHETTVKACEDFDRFCAKHEKIREQVKPEHSAVCYLRSGMAHAQMGDVESARTSFMRCQTDSSAVAKECQRALEMLPE